MPGLKSYRYICFLDERLCLAPVEDTASTGQRV